MLVNRSGRGGPYLVNTDTRGAADARSWRQEPTLRRLIAAGATTAGVGHGGPILL
jgi:hypothetical protein